jgi:predicted outer membrane lipoprotein
MAGSLNGKTGEVLRWLLGLALAAAVAYFTTIGSMNVELATVKATEQNHFSEVLRRLDDMKADLRELRSR